MEKIFVLDTNVLLHDPMALSAFKEHRVVIPMTVLEELDHIKDRRDKDVSRESPLMRLIKFCLTPAPRRSKRAYRSRRRVMKIKSAAWRFSPTS